MKGLAAAVLFGMSVSAGLGQTTCRYYTPQRVTTARENVAKYDWAKALRRRILERGDTIRYYIGPKYTAAKAYAAQSDEFLWLLQPSTTIPRVYDFSHTRALCPVHGAEVKRFNVWCPWKIDPLHHPYQIQCMLGKEWYPSNRYDEGDLTSGKFPDDGNGCLYHGKRYYFLREYAHMVYGSVVVPTLTSLSQAWLLTGDRRYAHKGCILLARLASQYPNYGWKGTDFEELENRFDRTYLGPWNNHHPYPRYSWKHGGLVTDLIWSTFMLEAEAYAYDALRDCFDDPGVLKFVRAKGLPVQTGDALRTYIENYILRAGAHALLTGEVAGNQGHHQAAAMAVALVLDDYGNRHPNSRDLVDYAYHGAGQSAYIFDNGLTRDGGGHESPSYNMIKFDFIRVARLMEQIRSRRPDLFPRGRYPDLFASPKARALFDFCIDGVLLDAFWPSVGDTGALRKPDAYGLHTFRYSFADDENLFAFQRYGDPRYARAATDKEGRLLGGDLWEPFPAERVKKALEDPKSRIVRRPRLLDGYGLAIVESGGRPPSHALLLNYSSLIGHRQNDQLAVYLYAHGVNLLPDLGYPRTWDYRAEWDANSLTHNTVTVDDRPYTNPRFFRNGCRLFASREGVSVINAFHNPYVEGTKFADNQELPCSLFERTCVVVTLDEDRFYVVDLFAVNGGHRHDQSWHGMYVEPTVPPLDWQAQTQGTLAGPDIPEFGAYTDPWGHTYPNGNAPSFITGVRRARLDKPAMWTWNSGLPTGDALALHLVPLGGPTEVLMGRGRSPVWVDEPKLAFLFVRHGVTGGETSRFLTILAPYQKTPVVERVRMKSEDPLVIEVHRPDGVDEIHLSTPPGPSRTTASRPLGVRVVSAGRDVAIGTYAPGAGPGYLTAPIVAVNHAHRQLDVPFTPGAAKTLTAETWIRIFNTRRTGMFEIEAAQRVADRYRLTLKRTALVSRFPVIGVNHGRLELGATGPFLTGHLDDETGKLTDGANDHYSGCWLGEGKHARQVLGIARATPPLLFLVDPPADETLKHEYVGAVVTLWDYNVGDTVEAARVESRRRNTGMGAKANNSLR